MIKFRICIPLLKTDKFWTWTSHYNLTNSQITNHYRITDRSPMSSVADPDPDPVLFLDPGSKIQNKFFRLSDPTHKDSESLLTTYWGTILKYSHYLSTTPIVFCSYSLMYRKPSIPNNHPIVVSLIFCRA
jgi:hypothetical protein